MTAPAAPVSASAELGGLLAEVLSFPGPALAAAARGGDLRKAVAHLVGHLEFELRAPLQALDLVIDEKELEAEYISLFDLPGKVQTPLYTGVYAPSRRDAMEELLRFYRFFGLTVQGGAKDLPDFVPTVLEFVGFLALGIQRSDAGTAAAMAAARIDVLERHLQPWAAQTAARFERREAFPFYNAVVRLLKELTEAEIYLARVQPATHGD